MTPCLNFIGRCIFLVLLFSSCKGKEPRNVQRSFYYWKTVFTLSPKEKETLQQHGVQNLYVKFFDVTWNSTSQSAGPVAKSIFQQKPSGFVVTPVVFIT
ncbi:MAG TPA: hypothetical protein VMR70_02510, partial [Flavisolibacter sp.]|nr:hypothetical protein [Flavisolibacter sp.]